MTSLKRSVVTILCWLLSGWAVFFSIVLIHSAIFDPSYIPGQSSVYLIKDAFLFSYAWLAFIIMNFAWIRGKKVHRFIPITGTLVGGYIVSTWLFRDIEALIYALSVICLATYLVYYHLKPLPRA